MSDNELQSKWSSGSPQERAELFAGIESRFRGEVMSLCLKRLSGDYWAAEDACQATFLELFTNLSESNVIPIASYLSSRGYYHCMQHWKIRTAHSRRVRTYAESYPVQEDKTEDFLTLHEAINNLPLGLRVPIELYFLENQTQAAIARLLNISERAVRSRIKSAQIQLKHVLGGAASVLVLIDAIQALAESGAEVVSQPASTTPSIAGGVTNPARYAPRFFSPIPYALTFALVVKFVALTSSDRPIIESHSFSFASVSPHLNETTPSNPGDGRALRDAYDRVLLRFNGSSDTLAPEQLQTKTNLARYNLEDWFRTPRAVPKLPESLVVKDKSK